MTALKRTLWAAAVGGGMVGGATAQTTTGGGGQASPQSAIQFQQAETPTITSTSEGAVQRSTAVAASNSFAGFYANPLYPGRAGALGTGLTTINAPGGFGVVLYSTTGGTSAAGGGGIGGAAGSAANRTAVGTTGLGAATGAGGRATGGLGATTAGGLGGATGGRAGGVAGFGGVTGFGGAGGTTAQTQQNQALSTGRQIAYTQELKFAGAPAVAPVQLQTELQTMLAASTPAGVSVEAGDGGRVVLRGRVTDADEARAVEGMIRLTPGVREVKNELTVK